MSCLAQRNSSRSPACRPYAAHAPQAPKPQGAATDSDSECDAAGVASSLRSIELACVFLALKVMRSTARTARHAELGRTCLAYGAALTLALPVALPRLLACHPLRWWTTRRR